MKDINEKEIVKGNLLIAEFMMPNGNPLLNVREAKYNISWDWLMPVVKKIFDTDTGTMDVYTLYVSDSLKYADINKVWETVIDFLQWYKSKGGNKP